MHMPALLNHPQAPWWQPVPHTRPCSEPAPERASRPPSRRTTCLPPPLAIVPGPAGSSPPPPSRATAGRAPGPRNAREGGSSPSLSVCYRWRDRGRGSETRGGRRQRLVACCGTTIGLGLSAGQPLSCWASRPARQAAYSEIPESLLNTRVGQFRQSQAQIQLPAPPGRLRPIIAAGGQGLLVPCACKFALCAAEWPKNGNWAQRRSQLGRANSPRWGGRAGGRRRRREGSSDSRQRSVLGVAVQQLRAVPPD